MPKRAYSSRLKQRKRRKKQWSKILFAEKMLNKAMKSGTDAQVSKWYWAKRRAEGHKD